MADQFADTDKPSSAKRQRTSLQEATDRATKPSLRQFFANNDHANTIAPGFGLNPPPQTTAPGFGPILPPPQAGIFPPNPYAKDAGPWELPQSVVNPWAPNLPGPVLPDLDHMFTSPENLVKLNYSQTKAKQAGASKYQPEVYPGSSFPQRVFESLIADDEAEDTPLQQLIKHDIETGATQSLDKQTMLKYADKQRNADKQEAERVRNEPRNKRTREVTEVGEQRDPKAPNGCIYRLCNMPRGEHSKGCLGVRREGMECTAKEHAVGYCDERDENRRQKLQAVGLDPDAVEGPLSTYEAPTQIYPSASTENHEAPDYFAGAMGGDENHFADAMDAMEAENSYVDQMEANSRFTHNASADNEELINWILE